MNKSNIKGIIQKIDNFINNYTFLIVLLLSFPHICHITLPYDQLPIYNYLLSRFTFLSFLIILFIYILIKRKKPSPLLILVIIFCTWATITTFINNPVKMNKMILYDCSSISLSMLVELFITDIKSLIRGLLINFEIQLYPNLITVFLYHNVAVDVPGYNNNNLFLGTRNDLILYLLPAFFLSILYYLKVKKSFRPILTITVVILTVILSESTTTLISFAYFCFMFIYCYVIRKNNIKHQYLLMSIPFLIYIVVVLPYFISGSNILVDFIQENIYYKHSFEARTLLWSDSRKYVLQKPLTGYGYYYENIRLIDNDLDVHCIAHNTFIQTALNYGFIGLLIFISIFIVLIKRVCSFKNSFIKTLCMCLISGIVIAFISQDYHRFFEFYIVLFASYYIDQI